MKTKKVVVEDLASLARAMTQHSSGKNCTMSFPDSVKDITGFLCRMKFNDGTVIDFYAPDADSAAQFPPEITGDTDGIVQKAIEDFVQIVSDPNPFVSVIKGHMYIESLITSILEAALLKPSKLEIDRLAFVRKVNFCIAAGLIHADVGHVLKEFAKIRNRFAHQLWPKLTEKELQDFLNVLRQSKLLKERLAGRNSEQLDVYDCVWAMYIYLLEQACRITSKRKLLVEFWQHVVDVSETALQDVTILPTKPITISHHNSGDAVA
jgi:hypothetical protein